MLNITGLVKLTKITSLPNTDKVGACTVYFGEKRQNSEDWDNSFFPAKLIGKANEKSFDVHDKDTVFITQGKVSNKSFEDKNGNKKSWLEVSIFDFIHGEEEIKKHLETLKKNTTEDTSKGGDTNKPARQRNQTGGGRQR